MRFGAFLRDRLAYILAYAALALLVVVVVQLDLTISGATLQRINLWYLFVLGLVGLVLFLWWDYQRQASFWQHIKGLTGQEPIEQLAALPPAPTAEGELYAQAWGNVYGRLSGELAVERERGQRQVRLLTQWAHHMKTPVSVIDLLLQRAKAEPWPADVRAILGSVTEENERLQHSLQMLLNMVRLQDFAGDFRPERVDLEALVRQLVNDHKREFIARRVYPRVEVTGHPQLPGSPYLVESDAKWLLFALEQVVSNALKYSARPKGEEGEEQGWVAFRLGREGTDVLLEVADNGIGIPLEDLGRIFDPFFTGLNGRSFPQATGMGLYLAREVCRRLGHTLRLESVPGKGTTVHLRLASGQTVFSGLRETLTTKMTEL